MLALIHLVVFINLAVSHHRMGRRKQTEKIVKPRTTGFVKLLYNLEKTKKINENVSNCMSSCVTLKAFHSLFMKNYNDQLFAYELEKAAKDLLNIVQRKKAEKRQKFNEMKTDRKKYEPRRAKGLSEIISQGGKLHIRFIRFS